MLMDDLKVYESWGQLERTVEEVEEVSEAMGMAFGLKKCVVVHRRVGRFSVEGELPLTQGREIPELEEGQSYKYLGVAQRMAQVVQSNQERVVQEYV